MTEALKEKKNVQNMADLPSDLPTITAEINTYKRIVGEAIFEIGRRLKHVKENDLAHGEFGKWLDKISMNNSQASRFIKVYEELGDTDLRSNAIIGFNNLVEIATLPPEQREAEHITAKGETKTPDEMTVKELRELKRQLKQTEQAKEMAEQQAKAERKERERLEAQEPEVRTEYVEVEKFPQDYEDLRKENETYRRLYGDSSIYDGDTRRVSDGDAITYTVLEFTEDIRNFIEKYGYLTHFPKEFEQMIPEGKERFKASINKLAQFLSGVEQAMDDDEIIIFEQ